MQADVVVVMLLSASLALLALLRGGKPERFCAAIIAFGMIADRVSQAHFDYGDFVRFSAPRLVLDSIQFAGFLYVALYANRFWPIWVAAAQAVAITGSFAPLAYQSGHTQAYWALTQLPLILQLLALGVGTQAHYRRVSRVGRYNCWSPRAN
jgi:hypothetical protein